MARLIAKRLRRCGYIFKPVALDSMKAMIDTYNRVLNRYMERGRAVR